MTLTIVQALVARSKLPCLMVALYETCIAEITQSFISSSSSSSSNYIKATESQHNDDTAGVCSLAEALRMWARLQVMYDE